MAYRLLADGVALLHLGFVIFVPLGGLLVLRWRRVAWVHLPAAAWGAWISLAGWLCPLTPIENRLRRLGGEAGYEGAFVDRYVVPLIYPPGLTEGLQWGIGLGVIAVNAAVYGWMLARRRAGRRG